MSDNFKVKQIFERALEKKAIFRSGRLDSQKSKIKLQKFIKTFRACKE